MTKKKKILLTVTIFVILSILSLFFAQNVEVNGVGAIESFPIPWFVLHYPSNFPPDIQISPIQNIIERIRLFPPDFLFI